METIFKKGDKVFDYQYGWGEVDRTDLIKDHPLQVKYERAKIAYTEDGCRNGSSLPVLSFTEYTLEGFSQECSVDYDDYVGKWGLFWEEKRRKYNKPISPYMDLKRIRG